MLAPLWPDVSDEGRGLFKRVIAATAAGHLGLVALLFVVEPAQFYNEDLLVEAGYAPHRGFAPPPNPEPKLPILWRHRWELGDLRVESTAAIAEDQIERLVVSRELADALFTGLYGLESRLLPPLKLRFVPLMQLNDPRYFNVSGDDGIYYGRYFPAHRISYLTPLAFDDERHFVHELAHYFIHEYGVEMPHAQEETRARRFERYVEEFARRRDAPHVVALLDLPEPPATGWRHDRELSDAVHLRAGVFLTVDRWAWLRETLAHAEAAFPEHAGVEPRPTTPLTLHIDRLPPPGPERRRMRAGLYDPEVAAALLSRRIFADAEPLSHVLAHHLVRSYELELSEQEEEILCFTFAEAVERARRGEPVRVAFERGLL